MDTRLRIADLLKSRKKSQADLAAVTGISESTISRFVSGNTDKLSTENIVAIARHFNVSYTPVALLSTQIIAGTNYCILCQITPVVPDPVPSWNLVYICSDPEGNARITNTWEIYVDRHAESDLVKQATE